ncbi:uncharacterized protein CLUP02_11560 [Colletotrichum lupini]|uniref:Uncharacterized protein n=1 Tax=Colletotrichum lupini TaxID=145971 RepID=A0A9Q8WJX8_9PEZI|nr:uncharacterized protein CLUP02_11560 [Colletotrichum lupini]UQC86061.1 hypothetical protein CLUP02_11560 [Colletotrichum lupini]
MEVTLSLEGRFLEEGGRKLGSLSASPVPAIRTLPHANEWEVRKARSNWRQAGSGWKAREALGGIASTQCSTETVCGRPSYDQGSARLTGITFDRKGGLGAFAGLQTTGEAMYTVLATMEGFCTVQPRHSRQASPTHRLTSATQSSQLLPQFQKGGERAHHCTTAFTCHHHHFYSSTEYGHDLPNSITTGGKAEHQLGDQLRAFDYLPRFSHHQYHQCYHNLPIFNTENSGSLLGLRVPNPLAGVAILQLPGFLLQGFARSLQRDEVSSAQCTVGLRTDTQYRRSTLPHQAKMPVAIESSTITPYLTTGELLPDWTATSTLHRSRELAAGRPAAVHYAAYEYIARSTVYTAPGGPVTVFSVLERSWLSEVSGGFAPFVSMVGCRIGTYPTPPSSPSSPSSNGSLAESVDAEDHLGFLIDGIADPADQERMEVREASDDDGHPEFGAACHGRIAEPALSHCVGIPRAAAFTTPLRNSPPPDTCPQPASQITTRTHANNHVAIPQGVLHGIHLDGLNMCNHLFRWYLGSNRDKNCHALRLSADEIFPKLINPSAFAFVRNFSSIWNLTSDKTRHPRHPAIPFVLALPPTATVSLRNVPTCNASSSHIPCFGAFFASFTLFPVRTAQNSTRGSRNIPANLASAPSPFEALTPARVIMHGQDAAHDSAYFSSCRTSTYQKTPTTTALSLQTSYLSCWHPNAHRSMRTHLAISTYGFLSTKCDTVSIEESFEGSIAGTRRWARVQANGWLRRPPVQCPSGSGLIRCYFESLRVSSPDSELVSNYSIPCEIVE